VKRAVAAFGAGALFGLGLVVSGMTRPSKVVGFLDLGGAWDASLAFVMMGAVGVYALAHRLALRRGTPLLAPRFAMPKRTELDRRLVMGAALFGIGWGIGGFCPGPGIVAAGSGSIPALVFVGAMTAGMWLQRTLDRASAREA
jgi:uncharacterized membrane protein YedE/YeeE